MPTISTGGQRRQPTPIVTVNVDGRCRTCRIQIAFHCRSPCVCTGFSAFEVSVPEKPMRYRKLGALLETRCTFRPLCQGNSVEKCTEFSVSAPSLPVVHRVLRGASNLVRCIGFVPDLHRTRSPRRPRACQRFRFVTCAWRRIALNAGGYDVPTARAVGEGA